MSDGPTVDEPLVSHAGAVTAFLSALPAAPLATHAVEIKAGTSIAAALTALAAAGATGAPVYDDLTSTVSRLARGIATAVASVFRYPVNRSIGCVHRRVSLRAALPARALGAIAMDV